MWYIIELLCLPFFSPSDILQHGSKGTWNQSGSRLTEVYRRKPVGHYQGAEMKYPNIERIGEVFLFFFSFLNTCFSCTSALRQVYDACGGSSSIGRGSHRSLSLWNKGLFPSDQSICGSRKIDPFAQGSFLFFFYHHLLIRHSHRKNMADQVQLDAKFLVIEPKKREERSLKELG